jgi:hypothetical protein
VHRGAQSAHLHYNAVGANIPAQLVQTKIFPISLRYVRVYLYATSGGDEDGLVALQQNGSPYRGIYLYSGTTQHQADRLRSGAEPNGDYFSGSFTSVNECWPPLKTPKKCSKVELCSPRQAEKTSTVSPGWRSLPCPNRTS